MKQPYPIKWFKIIKGNRERQSTVNSFLTQPSHSSIAVASPLEDDTVMATVVIPP